MAPIDRRRVARKKRTYSNGNGGNNCVEVVVIKSGVALRDSKDPAGPALTFSTPEWLPSLRTRRKASSTMRPNPQTRTSVPNDPAAADACRQDWSPGPQRDAAANELVDARRCAAAEFRLADRAYWLVHDDWSGDLRTSVRAAEVIVAAALLAELIHGDGIDVRDGAVRVFTPPPRLDELGSEVVAQLAAEPGIGCGGDRRAGADGPRPGGGPADPLRYRRRTAGRLAAAPDCGGPCG
jgi:hypothetical protein